MWAQIEDTDLALAHDALDKVLNLESSLRITETEAYIERKCPSFLSPFSLDCYSTVLNSPIIMVSKSTTTTTTKTKTTAKSGQSGKKIQNDAVSIGNKCGKCQNHEVEISKKGHARDCPFKKCDCLRCRLLDARSDILQVISGKETKLKGTKKDPNCGFCQNHGVKILRKGHVRSCGFGQERHFKLDNCFDCEVHYIRNEVNRLQIKMRRAMKEDRTLSEEQRKTAREAITREEVEKVCDMARVARKKRESALAQQVDTIEDGGETSSSVAAAVNQNLLMAHRTNASIKQQVALLVNPYASNAVFAAGSSSASAASNFGQYHQAHQLIKSERYYDGQWQNGLMIDGQTNESRRNVIVEMDEDEDEEDEEGGEDDEEDERQQHLIVDNPQQMDTLMMHNQQRIYAHQQQLLADGQHAMRSHEGATLNEPQSSSVNNGVWRPWSQHQMVAAFAAHQRQQNHLISAPNQQNHLNNHNQHHNQHNQHHVINSFDSRQEAATSNTSYLNNGNININFKIPLNDRSSRRSQSNELGLDQQQTQPLNMHCINSDRKPDLQICGPQAERLNSLVNAAPTMLQQNYSTRPQVGLQPVEEGVSSSSSSLSSSTSSSSSSASHLSVCQQKVEPDDYEELIECRESSSPQTATACTEVIQQSNSSGGNGAEQRMSQQQWQQLRASANVFNALCGTLSRPNQLANNQLANPNQFTPIQRSSHEQQQILNTIFKVLFEQLAQQQQQQQSHNSN